jgi:hypothetical protein
MSLFEDEKVNLRRQVRDPHLTGMKLLMGKPSTPTIVASTMKIRL